MPEQPLEFLIGRPVTSRRKRGWGTDITVEQSVGTTDYPNLLYIIGWGDFKAAKPPKANEAVWKVFLKGSEGKRDTIIGNNLTRPQALELAKSKVLDYLPKKD